MTRVKHDPWKVAKWLYDYQCKSDCQNCPFWDGYSYINREPVCMAKVIGEAYARKTLDKEKQNKVKTDYSDPRFDW